MLASLSISGRLFPRPSRPAVKENSKVADARGLPRQEIGPAGEHIYRKLREMYWKGVKTELAHIVLTLKKWQQTEYEKILLADEQDDFIHGFDTFVDQVTHSSREFARRHCEKLKSQHTSKPGTYEEALRDLAWSFWQLGEAQRLKGKSGNPWRKDRDWTS